ncbi:MAG: DUF2459 domain-containing protein [Pseudomonadales bacterium]|nr:DUF2459 domain-containing protein [Pseudomonadales bacterium]
MTRLLVVLLAGLLSLPVCSQGDNDNVTVLVVRHRWHTGIVFPADRLSPSLSFLSDYFSQPAFYEIGWGDDAFYRQDNNTWLLIRAMLWPTDGVLHVVGLDRHPAELPHGEIQALCVSSAQLEALQQAIAGDFVLNDDGQPADADPGLYGDSRFFPAQGTFWFGHTCNTWTAQRLETLAIPMNRLTLTAGGVLEQLRGQTACRNPDDY